MVRLIKTRSLFPVLWTILIAIFIAYSAYLYAIPDPREPGSSAEFSEGKLIWQQRNCQSCHQIYGLGGYLGPDLTNTYSLKGPEYIRIFLTKGTRIMPNFKLKNSEIRLLTRFLQTIDSSGRGDPRHFTKNWHGNISD
ncbi:MAG: cytochrome c [Ferruginibacter sp.]